MDFIDTYCEGDLIGFYLSVCIVKYVRLVDFVYLYCESGWFCLSLFWISTCLCLPCVRVCVVLGLLRWPCSLETKNNKRKRVRGKKKKKKKREQSKYNRQRARKWRGQTKLLLMGQKGESVGQKGEQQKEKAIFSPKKWVQTVVVWIEILIICPLPSIRLCFFFYFFIFLFLSSQIPFLCRSYCQSFTFTGSFTARHLHTDYRLLGLDIKYVNFQNLGNYNSPFSLKGNLTLLWRLMFAPHQPPSTHTPTPLPPLTKAELVMRRLSWTLLLPRRACSTSTQKRRVRAKDAAT